MTTTSTLKAEFNELFPNGLTLKQLWFLVKWAKFVRLSAKNNAAFNNAANTIFAPASFITTNKQRSDGTFYLGLKITTTEGAHEIEED